MKKKKKLNLKKKRPEPIHVIPPNPQHTSGEWANSKKNQTKRNYKTQFSTNLMLEDEIKKNSI